MKSRQFTLINFMFAAICIVQTTVVLATSTSQAHNGTEITFSGDQARDLFDTLAREVSPIRSQYVTELSTDSIVCKYIHDHPVPGNNGYWCWSKMAPNGQFSAMSPGMIGVEN